MKLLLFSVAFSVGAVFASGIRYSSVARQAYSRGIRDGLAECHREAVLGGHGDWTFPAPGEKPPVFRWKPANPDYAPDTMKRIDGFLDNP
jgi:hypothetical protein